MLEGNVGVGGTGVDSVAVGVKVSTGVGPVAVGVGDSPGVDEVGVDSVEVGVAVSSGVGPVAVGVGDSPGVDCVAVGVSIGVDVKVGVGDSPTTGRLVPVAGRLVSRLSPLETRALHSMGLSPACRPLTLKVKAAPPVVALLPLLPAMATMNFPVC